jgi:hypothetical protein
MNHREPPQMRVDPGRVLHYVALLLLPALAPTPTHANGRGGGGSESLPYLIAVGAPMLRFREAPLPPKISQRPVAAAPPLPRSEAPAPEAHAARPDALIARPPAPPAEAVEVSPVEPKLPTVEERKPAEPPAKRPPPPPAIIPDDTRPSVRPEDFLPFFQIPGPGGAPAGVGVIGPAPQAAPAPAPLPPSSAVYKQTL